MRSIFTRQRKVYRIEKKPILMYSLIALILLVTPYLLTFVVEFIQRHSIHETWHWMTVNWNLVTLNVLLDLLLMLLIYSLVGSLVPSIALTALLLALGSMISYYKVKLIGVPFFPWDLKLNKEIIDILPLVMNPGMLKWIGILAVAIIAIFLLRLLTPSLTLPPVSRIIVGLVSIVALYLFTIKSPPVEKLMNHMQVFNYIYNQQQNYTSNGQSLAFMLNLQNSKMAEPAGYGEAAIKTLANAITAKSPSISAVAALGNVIKPKQPNVIFVMNEAFWDPTLMTDVAFSEDPLPTIHQLQKETTSGYLLSPQIGGGTSNVEFEVLTGQSMSFLPNGSIPYQQYIHKSLPSLASYYADQGYKSIALHSYVSYFYNRENVYNYFGFESFKSAENFQNPEYKGGFISDDEFSRNIIEQVDQTDKPMFIYGISMQNHGPYDDVARYKDKKIKVKGNFNASAQTIIENYTQGAHDADHSLKLLIDHFKQSDEPTVIIFYGDHLPMLGYSYEVYAQSGFVKSNVPEKWSLEEIKKMHSVPLVMWSNISLPKKSFPILSPSFLGVNVLDMLNMEMPATFNFNFELSQKIPGLLSNLVVDANQQLYATTPEDMKPSITEYSQLEYDMLFGKRYLANFIDHDFLTKATNPNYNVEFKNK